jgi:hypothetical protein
MALKQREIFHQRSQTEYKPLSCFYHEKNGQTKIHETRANNLPAGGVFEACDNRTSKAEQVEGFYRNGK